MSNRDTSASSRTANLKAKTLAIFHRNNPDVADSGPMKGSSATVLLNRKNGRELLPYPCCLAPTICPPLGSFSFSYYNFWYVSQFEEYQNNLRILTGDPTLTIPPPPAGYDANIPAFNIKIEEVPNATQYTASISDPTNSLSGSQAFIGPYSTPLTIVPNSIFLFFYPNRTFNDDNMVVFVSASDACENRVSGNSVLLPPD